jgi:hypothetical protein
MLKIFKVVYIYKKITFYFFATLKLLNNLYVSIN